jgi:hypothetical protein
MTLQLTKTQKLAVCYLGTQQPVSSIELSHGSDGIACKVRNKKILRGAITNPLEANAPHETSINILNPHMDE